MKTGDHAWNSTRAIPAMKVTEVNSLGLNRESSHPAGMARMIIPILGEEPNRPS